MAGASRKTGGRKGEAQRVCLCQIAYEDNACSKAGREREAPASDSAPLLLAETKSTSVSSNSHSNRHTVITRQQLRGAPTTLPTALYDQVCRYTFENSNRLSMKYPEAEETEKQNMPAL